MRYKLLGARRKTRDSHSVRSPFQLATRNSQLATRHGILLLVVLSMLVLFLMLGTAFVIATKQSSQAARSLQRAYEAATSPMRQDDLLEEVFGQLLRDTNRRNSSLRFHSLLRDLYGNDGFSIGPNSAPKIQFFDRINNETFSFEDEQGNIVTTATLDDQILSQSSKQFLWVGVKFDPASEALSPIRNFYNGNIFTLLDGNAKNIPSRILRYEYHFVGPGDAVAYFMVMPIDMGKQISVEDIKPEYRAWINGRPFSGMGAGYNPLATADAMLNTMESVSGTNRVLALLPNSVFFDVTNVDTGGGTGSYGPYYNSQWGNLSLAQQQQLLNNMGLVGQGGSDESYDAVDYQNMFLGLLPANPIALVSPGANSLDNMDGSMVLPSFHRPALLNYWNAQSSPAIEPNLLRKILLRPNWYDHPDFTGSNPDLASTTQLFATALRNNNTTEMESQSNILLQHMIYGPWDVDNDNDGVRDSVWVDFGSPIINRPDGTMVKPLAAILCLDMDGRLNLNAHGSLDIASPTDFNKKLAGSTSSDRLPQGEGYGPADVSLESILADPANGANSSRFDEILIGYNNGTVNFPGRYGTPGTDNQPGKPGQFSLLAQLKMQGLPRAINQKSAYNTPSDLKGRYSLGLNDLGQPVHEVLLENSNDLDWNTPYELNLSQAGAYGTNPQSDDNPFTPGELERLLRAYDTDAGTLAPRLWELAGKFESGTTTNIDELNQWRTLLTTDSFDLPVPNGVLPAWMRLGPDGTNTGDDDFATVMNRSPVNVTFSDLLEYRIRVKMEIAKATETPDDLKLIQQHLKALLSPDLADGLRLDINRALGNGRDDNNNGVVDEPDEMKAGSRVWNTRDASFGATGTPLPNAFTDARFLAYDTDNDGAISQIEELQAQQLLARHLYVMAMTLVDPFDTTTVKGKAKVRRLAQWAINVVDFRDANNCMSPFEYDENPFDGWDPAIDGVPKASYATANPIQLVWGCERPELVMTETLAWHDRRTTDETLELPEPNHTAGSINAQKDPDFDYDQLYQPRGAFFLELYNPWPENPGAGTDTHAIGGFGGNTDFDRNGTPDPQGQDMGVNLSAVAVDPDDNTKRSPVWRLSIHKPKNTTLFDTVMWDPDDPDTSRQPNDGSFADRTVYFTRQANVPTNTLQAMDGSDGVEYFTSLNVPSVRPGRYLVVGSGEEVTAGSEYFASIGRSLQGGGTRGIRLRTKFDDPSKPPVVYEEPDGTDVKPPSEGDLSTLLIPASADLQVGTDPDLSICNVAVINQSVDQFGNAVERRLTITEPAKGYPNITLDGIHYSPNGGPDGTGWYGTASQPKPIDIPLDDQRADGDWDGENRLSLPANNAAQRIIECFSWIYLQRLANPLLPFNPAPGKPGNNPNRPANPYLTVDAISANATVFNGEVTEEQRWPISYKELEGEVEDPGAPPWSLTLETYGNDYAVPFFASHQRGFTARSKGEKPQLWASERPNGAAANNMPGGDQGAMNLRGMVRVAQNQMGANGAGRGLGSHTLDAIVDCTLGYLNRHYCGTTEPNNPNERIAVVSPPTPQQLVERQVIPRRPFPWLAWNNRPYVSQLELMQVPVTRSSQLTRAFSTRVPPPPTGTSGNEIYTGTTAKWPGNNAPDTITIDGPFGHLPNFYRIAEDTSKTTIAGLYRVFDYLHVPSRFVGTETWFNPSHFGNPLSAGIYDPLLNRQPPFNRISTYREPGRVNLNTIISADVWEGGILNRKLFDPTQPWGPANLYQESWLADPTLPEDPNGNPRTYGHVGPSSSALTDSRRGYGQPNSSSLLLDDTFPSFFANPFRSADAADLVPLTNMVVKDANGEVAGVNCTILRQAEVAAGKPPLFAGNTVDDPATPTVVENQHRNSNRNSYFRNQPLTRLANLTTNRSNVFAVWVTIGFFEVEEVPSWGDLDNTQQGRYNNDQALYNRVYPDGYTFGRETGSETGDIRRLRGFSIIDRTIPVAFEPGQQHDSRKAVRLRRRIE